MIDDEDALLKDVRFVPGVGQPGSVRRIRAQSSQSSEAVWVGHSSSAT